MSDIAAIAILTDGKDVLIQVKDQQHPWGGCGLWSLFGGKIEEGETERIALARELDEELSFPWWPENIVWLPDVLATDAFGNQWTWRATVIHVDSLDYNYCTEGIPVCVSIPCLKSAVEMEGQPLKRGKNKGNVQNLFFPGIADVFRLWFKDLS